MEKVIVKRSGEWVVYALELYEVQCEIKRLGELADVVKDELIRLSERVDSKCNGFEFKFLSRPGSVKYKDIPELKDVDLDPYRGNTVSFWKLLKKW